MPYVRKKDYPCLRCKKHVKITDKAIKCNVCELWLHQKCPGSDELEVTQELFDALDAQKTLTGDAYWRCASCRSFAAKLDARVNALGKQLDDVEKRVGTHDSEIEKLKEEVAKLKEDAKAASVKAKPDAVKEAVTVAVFKELRERDAKRFNVLVQGLPEASRTVKDGKARKDADLARLQDMVNVLELELDVSQKVRSASRLGKKGEAARPLLVSFRDPGDQESVLDNAPKLNRAADALWKGVRLLQDLTKIQRQEDKHMRQECDELAMKLNDEDSKNFMFRVVGPRGARRIAKVPISTAAPRRPRPANPRASQARAAGVTTPPPEVVAAPPSAAPTPQHAAASPQRAAATPQRAAATPQRAVATTPEAPAQPTQDEDEEGPWTPAGRHGRHGGQQTPRHSPGTPQPVTQVTAQAAASNVGVERRTSARNQARVQQQASQPAARRGGKATRGKPK